MKIDFHDEDILISRLKRNDKPTTFLFGSAFSQVTDGDGIPNVDSVCEFIAKFADENDVLEAYTERLGNAESKDYYQKAFSLIAGLLGQDAVNEIINRVVRSNFDDEGKQRIPKSVKDFVTSVKQGCFNVGYIITTNFDTLLEEEFKNQGIPVNSASIVADSYLQDSNDGRIKIIHLHGVWDRGDSMHTTTQLETSRDRIESSLQNLIDDQKVVVMGYSGWKDSFTRSLATAVKNNKSKYDLLWCFFEKTDAIIEKNEEALFTNVSDAMSRGRIQFFKGIDCNSVFSKTSLVSATKKKRNIERELDRKRLETVNYYDIEDRGYSRKVREKERLESIDILTRNNALFVQGELGSGIYDFISSLKNSVDGKTTKCVRIDCAEVISKNQVDNQILNDSGQAISQLIFLLNSMDSDVYFILFDKIRGNAGIDALLYILDMPNKFNLAQKNVFFIFTSSVDIKQFHNIRIKLEVLDLHDTQLILHDKFGVTHFNSVQISQIYERSEGVIDKLEQIMDYMEISSVEEVLSQDDIFDDEFYTEHIPSTTRKQIDILIAEPEKALTLKMLNILSILKNGETLTNLRKDKMGADLQPKNTQELVRLELASTVMIDSSTMLIKINPIIKDYIINRMSREKIADISNAYLKVTVIETQKGVKLSSINRKIYQTGYNTEEDNTCTLLSYSIQDCKKNIEENELKGESNEMNHRRMDKLRYLSGSYVYILINSSRFAETISAVENLIEIVKEVDRECLYKYYLHIASAHRMKSNHREAECYLNLCEECCPETDKKTQEEIYKERLYLLEQTDIHAAIQLAKKNKNNYHKNSAAYILSDVILAESKESESRFKTLAKLEKLSRKLGHFTLANNILFTLNNERNNAEKITALDEALKSDKSAYNICRATIYKHQALIENNNFSRIKDSDISQLVNIYNYLFRQKIDSLFSQCHQVLWAIAENMKRRDVIHLIFFKGTIVWRLNSDYKREEKYACLFEDFTNSQLLEAPV